MKKQIKFYKYASAFSLALALSACSIFSNEDIFEPADLTDYEQSFTGNTRWTTSIGSKGGLGFAPAVINESIYAATPEGQVAKVGLNSGDIQWRTSLDKQLTAGAGSDGQHVAVGTRDGHVVLLNANDGSQLWEKRTAAVVSTPPVIHDGVVVVRSDDYRVRGYDVADGELLWSYLRTNSPMSLKANSRMFISDDLVVVPVPMGRLVGINVKTGEVKWDRLVSPSVGATDLDVVTDIVGLPIRDDNTVCLNTYQGNVSCYELDADNEPSVLWRQKNSSAVGPGYSNGLVYSSSIHGKVNAYSIQNGDSIWSDQTLKNRRLTNPVILNNILMVGDYQGYVHFYDAQKGQLLGRLNTGSSQPIQSPLTLTSAGVLVQTGAGSLQMLGSQ